MGPHHHRTADRRLSLPFEVGIQCTSVPCDGRVGRTYSEGASTQETPCELLIEDDDLRVAGSKETGGA